MAHNSHGDSKGKDMLVNQSVGHESPRALESASVDGPSEWGKGGKSFSVGQASEGSTSVANPCGVDLASGDYTCQGHKQTKAGEVVDPNVSIG